MSDAHDLGTAIHYTSVKRGTPVFSSDGVEVGKVRKVQDNFAEHILDGFEIEAADGSIRFVDGPEVERTFERGVTLGISADEVDAHAEVRSKNPLGGGMLSRFFSRGG